MASDFVRKVKGIRNIDILSPNITTENDLISTIDGEVYVATNKGYRKITGVETKEIKQLKTDVSNVKKQSDTNTLNISNLTDDIESNTSDIKSLRTSTGNNTSKISDLNQQLIDFTDDFEMLNTTTKNNKSEIETLKTNDTGWIPFDLINGAVGDNTFKGPNDNGFDCAYRIIEKDGVSEKHLRINAKNIVHRQVIAQLPEGFAKNLQYHSVKVPVDLGLNGTIGVYPSGRVYVYVNSDKQEEWESRNGDDVYFYGEINWLD